MTAPVDVARVLEVRPLGARARRLVAPVVLVRTMRPTRSYAAGVVLELDPARAAAAIDNGWAVVVEGPA